MINTRENPTYSPTGNTEKDERAQEIVNWSVDDARQAAKEQGMELNDDHIKVMLFLRDFYVEYGWPKQTHELSRILGKEFDELGGKKYLHKLFPDGPLAQGSKLAGLPEVAYAVDESFGSTH